jgi:hypothetical protein
MLNQKALQGKSYFAEKLEVMEIKTGDVLIERRADDDDMSYG